MQTFPVIKRLPTAYYTHIGRVVSRWAYLEGKLRRIVFALLQVGPKHGRIAVREPRVVEFIEMVEDLLYLEKIQTRVDLKKLKKALQEIESHRNKISHGIWVKHPNSKTPILQDTKGTHPKESRDFDQHPKARKGRINPKAMNVTIANFKNWTGVIDNAVAGLERLASEIDAQRLSSLKTKQ